jgi:outer membrane protein OmpA-like peptidoglycan-associated protein
LKALAKTLNSDSCGVIKIFGYTDTAGSREYNKNLSKKRVYSVYDYLLSCNTFDTSKVYMEWLGESDDAYDLHLPNAHILQRSVDIRVFFNNRISTPANKKDH